MSARDFFGWGVPRGAKAPAMKRGGVPKHVALSFRKRRVRLLGWSAGFVVPAALCLARAWPPLAAIEEQQLPHSERQECEHREVFIQPGGGKEAERPSEAVKRRGPAPSLLRAASASLARAGEQDA